MHARSRSTSQWCWCSARSPGAPYTPAELPSIAHHCSSHYMSPTSSIQNHQACRACLDCRSSSKAKHALASRAPTIPCVWANQPPILQQPTRNLNTSSSAVMIQPARCARTTPWQVSYTGHWCPKGMPIQRHGAAQELTYSVITFCSPVGMRTCCQRHTAVKRHGAGSSQTCHRGKPCSTHSIHS